MKPSEEARTKAAARVRKHREGMKRIDFAPDPESLRLISAMRRNCGSTSQAINLLLHHVGRAALSADESMKLDALVMAERTEGMTDRFPLSLLDDVREFQHGAGHATLAEALDDLRTRSEARIAEQAQGETQR